MELADHIKATSEYINQFVKLIPEKFYKTNQGADDNKDQYFGKFARHTQNAQELNQMKKKARREKLIPKEAASEPPQNDQPEIEGETRQLVETKSVSIDELRTKLHQKIATLQSKRGLNGKSVGGVVEEPKSRQALLEARQARKQARKQKRKQESQQISSSATTTDASSKRKQPFDDGRIGDAAGAFGSAVKFSKIDFGAKKKRTKLDPKLALKKLQEEKSKAIQLDSNEASALEQKQKWNRALSLASGDKLQDDERLLKKTIKRDEKRKQASGNKWKERKQNIEQDQQERQEKRQKNIQKRIDEKKERRMGLGKKKKPPQKPKKARAGFEGKR